jgi:hypothetical protein
VNRGKLQKHILLESSLMSEIREIHSLIAFYGAMGDYKLSGA